MRVDWLDLLDKYKHKTQQEAAGNSNNGHSNTRMTAKRDFLLGAAAVRHSSVAS
jgi:hypothetical protein